jgi:hypothetical protein
MHLLLLERNAMSSRRNWLLHLALVVAVVLGWLLFDYMPMWLSVAWWLGTFVLGVVAVAVSWKLMFGGSKEDSSPRAP